MDWVEQTRPQTCGTLTAENSRMPGMSVGRVPSETLALF